MWEEFWILDQESGCFKARNFQLSLLTVLMAIANTMSLCLSLRPTNCKIRKWKWASYCETCFCDSLLTPNRACYLANFGGHEFQLVTLSNWMCTRRINILFLGEEFLTQQNARLTTHSSGIQHLMFLHYAHHYALNWSLNCWLFTLNAPTHHVAKRINKQKRRDLFGLETAFRTIAFIRPNSSMNEKGSF